MNSIILGVLIFLSSLAFFGLYIAYKGPDAVHRVIAINVIFTKSTVMIVLLSVLTNQYSFVDVALVYALMGFVATVAVSKYLEKGKLK